jgi:glutamate-1-semialdehyde 2,1-aminomutase
LYASLASLTRRLAAGLAAGARQAGVAVQINAYGSMLTPFFTNHPVRGYASATTADTVQYARFFRGMLARGIYLPPSQFEAWFLSAAHSERDIDRTVAAAAAAFQACKPTKP